jgi:hypothetical protein
MIVSIWGVTALPCNAWAVAGQNSPKMGLVQKPFKVQTLNFSPCTPHACFGYGAAQPNRVQCCV